MAKISPKQQRFLLERLDQLRRAQPHEHQERPDYKAPPAIAKAQKEIDRLQEIVSEHDYQRDKARKLRNDNISAAYLVCKEQILFGDEAKALAALKAFEKKKF